MNNPWNPLRIDKENEKKCYNTPATKLSPTHQRKILGAPVEYPAAQPTLGIQLYISPRGELHAQKMQTVHQSARVVFRAKQANKSVEQMSWSAVECELLRRGDRMEKRRGK